MEEITNTDDYEKSFLSKYLKAQANKKIKNLELQIENTIDSFKILKLKREITEIEKLLNLELKRLEEKEQKPELIEVGSKSEKIDDYSENDVFIYNNIKIPTNIWNYLFEYQKLGVQWMINLFIAGKGGVLADEMGLGKTIQVCTVVISLFNSQKARNFLILSPATVINHWINEFNKLKPCPTIYKELSVTKKGIFVLSYEGFRVSQKIPTFDLVFLDEGHKIKNKNSLISQSAKLIESTSRFVITGTPIQNNLAELWSIFDFVNPNLLGSYTTFKDEFGDRIKHSKNESEKEISYHYSVMLRSIIEPYMLRRLKSLVEHILPNKLDKVIFINLSDKQINMYIEALRSKKFNSLEKKGFKSKEALLGAITYLRKICNHPLLLECKNDDSSDTNSLEVQNYEIDELINYSSKLKISFEMLDKWYEENNKALMFFQTYKMLQITKTALLKFRPNIKFLEMTGRTLISKRSALIDTFNNDESVNLFLLTTRVGGLGLNLTGANRIIIYDPDWNPSTDTQAKERIYRYGQKSDIEIYRLICRDTIEEKIYQKQIYKDSLTKKILNNPNINYDREYFFDLFDFQQSLKNGTEIVENNEFVVENDKLVDVKEEDKRDFSIFKEMNSKIILSGEELIDFIKRRECNLNTDIYLNK